MKRTGFVVAVLSLLAALLLGSPLHAWINTVAQGSVTATVVLWIAVLATVAGLVWLAVRLQHGIAHWRLKKSALILDTLQEFATICQHDGRQLQDEASNEQNDDVEFQLYREMARMLEENLELLWRGSDASILVLSRKGLPLEGAMELMQAIERHYDVEIDAPLSSRPATLSDKRKRIQEAGFGGRCVSLLCGQLVRSISRLQADFGAGTVKGDTGKDQHNGN